MQASTELSIRILSLAAFVVAGVFGFFALLWTGLPQAVVAAAFVVVAVALWMGELKGK